MNVYWPVLEPSVTEEAGTRGGAHAGIDLAAELDDPVLAAFDGEVVYVGGDGAKGRIWVGWTWVEANGEGKTVDIRREDGLISRVCHLNGYAVKPGQKVKAGDVVGYAGSTGFSLGVHVHWETRWNRNWVGSGWVNPRNFNPKTLTKSTTSLGKKPMYKSDWIKDGHRQKVAAGSYTYLEKSKKKNRGILTGAASVIGEISVGVKGKAGTVVRLRAMRERHGIAGVRHFEESFIEEIYGTIPSTGELVLTLPVINSVPKEWAVVGKLHVNQPVEVYRYAQKFMEWR